MSGLDSAGTTAVLVLLAIAVGSGLAQLLPGKLRGRRKPPIAGVGLLGAGIGARLAVELLDIPGGLIVLIASFGLLVAACVLNLTRAGTPVVTLGLVVMLAPTVVNGGMPVSADALRSMDMSAIDANLPGERHVEVEYDQLRVLGDVLPLPFGGRPVSFGELIALVGLADVAFHAVGRKTGRRRRTPRGPARRLDPILVLEEPIDDGEPSVVVLGPVSSRRASAPKRNNAAAPQHSNRVPARRSAGQSFWSDPFSNDPFETDPFGTDPFGTDAFGTGAFETDPTSVEESSPGVLLAEARPGRSSSKAGEREGPRRA
jgi:hypothetical protein